MKMEITESFIKKLNENIYLLFLIVSPVFLGPDDFFVVVIFWVVLVVGVALVVVGVTGTGIEPMQQTMDCVPTNPHIWGKVPPLILSMAAAQSVRNWQTPTTPRGVLHESPEI